MRLPWHIWMLFMVTICFCLTNSQKTQMTRTALHVARSLDPDSMETLSVKTKTGDLATIIVKRRNGKLNTNFANVENSSNVSKVTNESLGQNQETRVKQLETSEWNRTFENSNEILEANDKSGDNSYGRQDSGRSALPNPVMVSSVPVFVKGEQGNETGIKKGKSIIKVGSDGIPVVTGVRVPDDDSDKQVWRNARVINGILVPYNKTSDKVSKPSKKPAASTFRPVLLFSGTGNAEKPDKDLLDQRMNITTPFPNEDGWMKVGIITKKPTKIIPLNRWKYPTLESRSTTEKNPNTETLILETVEEENKTKKKPNAYKQHPLGLWVPAENQYMNSEESYVADKILDYIRRINKDETKRLSAQKVDNTRDSRMIRNDEPQMQARILHAPVGGNFPNSAIYSPSTPPPSRVSFEEGVRNPVLQYAHPEYGIQSAHPSQLDIETESKKGPSELYYQKDFHSDRGPFIFEPGNYAASQINEEMMEEMPPLLNLRPKKTSPWVPEKSSVGDASNKFNTYNRYPKSDYYSYSQHYPAPAGVMYYGREENKPFWIKLGDSLKQSMQNGIEKVTVFTRPVVEPIIEASSKITENLGISSTNRELSTIKERIGSVSPSSLILPAIGIVAGGAALGLGAVAVGRYLNYDVVRMRSGKSLDDQLPLNAEEIQKSLTNLWTVDESRSPTESSENSTKTKTEKKSNFTVSSPAASNRRKRSATDVARNSLRNMLQGLEQPGEKELSSVTYPSDVWSDTPCSKKTFCEVMVSQPEDSVLLMEKKMINFLSKLPSNVAILVSPHLDEVMSSVRRKSCSAYSCRKDKKKRRSYVPEPKKPPN